MKKIIVAGAGHGGLAAAALLAKQGYDVTVIEAKKRAEMGHDWHDVMSKSSLGDAGFSQPAEGTFTPYTNTSYLSPSQQTEIAEPYKVSEWSGYIDRKELLKHLMPRRMLPLPPLFPQRSRRIRLLSLPRRHVPRPYRPFVPSSWQRIPA